jgi:excisionase family DNA binding protein
MAPSPFLTIPDVAARLQVSTLTVRRLIRSGRLPAVRVGVQVRVPEDFADNLPAVCDDSVGVS